MNYDGYHYGRQGSSFAPVQPLPPAVKTLLIVNAAFFVLRLLTGPALIIVAGQAVGSDHGLDLYLGLVPGLVLSRIFLWQFVTYMFLHAGLLHILFNMLVLYMFGKEIEPVIGSRRFAYFYFFCGVGAGLCSFIFYPETAVIIGASGAVFGILVAFGMLFPERVVTLLVFFLFPVNMKAKHLVLIFVGAELLLVSLNVPGDPIAHLAHLGGALFGFLYMKNIGRVRAGRGPRVFRRARLRLLDNDSGENADLREQVDAVLDKISRHGVSNLTEREKAILRRAKDEF